GNQEAAAWNPESKSRGARAAPDLVRTGQQALPASFHAAVWRRNRRTAIDRKRGSARGRAGNSGQAARQKTRNAVSAFRRRAGADRASADLRGVSDQPGTNLRAGRSGRAARRSQRGALLRPARRNDKIDRYALRDHYAQSDHDGAHEPPLRRHDGRARCLAACFGRSRSRRAVPRGELILLVASILGGAVYASSRGSPASQAELWVHSSFRNTLGWVSIAVLTARAVA